MGHSRRIVFIADMHVGSLFAIWPKSWTSDEGVQVKASKAQLQLVQYWEDFWAHEAKEADTIVLLGDLCQGDNYRETGRGTTTTELEAQTDVALDLLKKPVGNRTVIGVSGTKYHDALKISLDKRIINALGGNFLGMIANVKIKDMDKAMNIAHGTGGSALYDGTISDRESLFFDIAEARGTLPHIDLIVRGHLHHFWCHHDRARTFLRLPCWQCWFPWVGLVGNYAKKQPDIGAVTVDVGKRIEVHQRIYPSVHIHDGLSEV